MQSIHELFDRCVATAPDHPFLICKDRTLSFSQLGVMVDALVAELQAHDVKLGDRVLAIAENCPEHVALILACSTLGAWSCGVNARMAGGEVAAFAQKADAKLIYFTSDCSQAAAGHALAHKALGVSLLKASALQGLSIGVCGHAPLAEPEPLASQVAGIIFTSGTTGASKGVLITHQGLLAFGGISATSRALSPKDRTYAYVPMTHIFGLGTVLMAALASGSTLLMRQQFDPADVLLALAHEQLTNLQGPPALFNRILKYCDEHAITHIDTQAAPHLDYLYTGAAPLDLSLKNRVQVLFDKPLHHGYGLSEYAGALTLCHKNTWRDDTSAGYLVEGGEVKIDSPDVNGVGEIWMRGVGLMPGYFRDTAATDAVMRAANPDDENQARWYASGDLGRLGSDGALTVVGRLKEMIVRSGFNVYPAEVEAALHALPEVARAAVVGQKEADGNESVVAFVELKLAATKSPETLKPQLLHALRVQLSPYKIPQQMHFVTRFPETSSGKILKRELLAGAPPTGGGCEARGVGGD